MARVGRHAVLAHAGCARGLEEAGGRHEDVDGLCGAGAGALVVLAFAGALGAALAAGAGAFRVGGLAGRAVGVAGLVACTYDGGRGLDLGGG